MGQRQQAEGTLGEVIVGAGEWSGLSQSSTKHSCGKCVVARRRRAGKSPSNIPVGS